MTDYFDQYYQRLLKREGGDAFTDYRWDRGGATKYGITLATLRSLSIDMDGDGDVDAVDVKLLDNDTSKWIYKREFFEGPGVNLLPAYLQELVFDMCVHFGPRGGVRVLQHTINSRLDTNDFIAVDGYIGPVTISHVIKLQIEVNRVIAFRVKRLASIFAEYYADDETNIWYGFFNRALALFDVKGEWS